MKIILETAYKIINEQNEEKIPPHPTEVFKRPPGYVFNGWKEWEPHAGYVDEKGKQIPVERMLHMSQQHLMKHGDPKRGIPPARKDLDGFDSHQQGRVYDYLAMYPTASHHEATRHISRNTRLD
jgi:hypothetical protein